MPPDYPISEDWLFDLGFAVVEHEVTADRQLRFRIVSGLRAGQTGVNPVDIVSAAPQLFIVSWQEEDGHTVVHVEDFQSERFRAFVTTPGGDFHRIEGPMRRA